MQEVRGSSPRATTLLPSAIPQWVAQDAQPAEIAARLNALPIRLQLWPEVGERAARLAAQVHGLRGKAGEAVGAP